MAAPTRPAASMVESSKQPGASSSIIAHITEQEHDIDDYEEQERLIVRWCDQQCLLFIRLSYLC